MALSAWPDVPNAWLEDYIVWRINSGDPDFRPPEVPLAVPPYAIECLNWCIWRRKGRPLPRPDVIKTIPGWAYAILDGVNERAPIQIPTTPASWILTWCIWRFKNSPVPKPTNIPAEVSVVAPYCWSVLNWMAWKRAQISVPSTPRPKNIPASIPNWCFGQLRQVNQAVPPKPPPPPPPPPDPDKPPTSWHLPNPIMFTSWGWFSDARYRDNDEALQDMRAAGVKTVALQIAGGQPLYNPDVPGRCRAFGMKVALWGRAAPGDAECLALAKADGYMPQIEGPGEYDDAIAQLEAGTGTGLSLSTITTLGAMVDFIWLPPTTKYPNGKISTVQCERLKELGMTHAWVECYIQDGGAHFPISTMMWSADQRGFPWFNPVIGLYHETQVSAYRPLSDPNTLDSYGKQVGAYLSEGMIPQNWVDFAELGT